MAWKGIVGEGFTVEEFEHYVDKLTFGAWRPQFVVLHNTEIPRIAQWHTTPGKQRMRNLEVFYRDKKGWSAGPHLFVADDLIWVFTPLTTSGVHSPSWNKISWGVEMVGDYSTESFTTGMGEKVRDNAVEAVATLHARLGLDPQNLRLHKEDKLTTHNCPGKNVQKNDFIQRVQNRLIEIFAGEHDPASGASD
ncbi:hypothetical protein GCM10028808_47000 [Spirosoma migulaei]